MFFTKEDIQKIKKAIFEQGVKDTDFKDADDLIGEEYIVVVQDNQNKKIKVSDIIKVVTDTLFIPKVRDIRGNVVEEDALSYRSGAVGIHQISSDISRYVKDCFELVLYEYMNEYITKPILGLIKNNGLTNIEHQDPDTYETISAVQKVREQDVESFINNYFPDDPRV